MKVLVTGGHSRLGGAISEELARAGHGVLIHYHANEAAAAALKARLEAEFGVACGVARADLTDAGQTEGLIQKAIEAGCDALVASASLLERDLAGSFDQGAWDRAHMIHYWGPVRMSVALRAAVERCAVVVVSDQAALGPTEDFFSYSMSKRSMIAALPSLALCVAPGRANIVAPGFTLPTINAPEADFESAHEATILGRGSRAEDVAGAVRQMLEAQAVSGQVLAVDGGQSLARPAPRGLSFPRSGEG